MNPKAKKIVTTTINLFLKNGIKKVTMDEIAENANVSKVTIYKYFIDKDTLYLEIGKFIFSHYQSRLNILMASGEPVIKKLYSFLDMIRDFTNKGQFHLCHELSKYNHQVAAEYELFRQTHQGAILSLIDEGKNNHLIRDELDSSMIFHYIDMGIAYYQQNLEYRTKMLNDPTFQKEFLWFYMRNIFQDGSKILADL